MQRKHTQTYRGRRTKLQRETNKPKKGDDKPTKGGRQRGAHKTTKGEKQTYKGRRTNLQREADRGGHTKLQRETNKPKKKETNKLTKGGRQRGATQTCKVRHANL